VSDTWFVIAGYGVILGGLAAYAVALARRLARAREASLRIRGEAESGAASTDPRA